MSMRKILTVCFLLVCILALAGCGGQAGKNDSAKSPDDSSGTKPEITDITFYGVNDPQISAAQIIAEKKGFFKEEGLNVTNKLMLNVPEIAPVVASGEAKITTANNYSLPSWVANGVKIKNIAPTTNMGGTQALILRKGEQITSAKDLEGKKMGMVPGSTQLVVFLNMSRALGVDPSKITQVPLQFADQFSALENGGIDIMACPEPWVTKTVAAGHTLLATGTKSYLPGAEGDVDWCNMYATVAVQEDFMKQNPETLRRILRAMAKATDYINNNRADAIKILAQQFHLPEKDLEEIMKKNVYKFGVDDVYMSSTDKLAQFIYEQKLTKRLIKRDEYNDFSLLKEAVPAAYTAAE
jgi:NitT/TauT family transport system substrate-binding protein